MKKFLLVLFSFFCTLPIFAKGDFYYSAQITLKKDASAEIQERITFYADSEIEIPVLKRTINAEVDVKKIFMKGNPEYLSFTIKKP